MDDEIKRVVERLAAWKDLAGWADGGWKLPAAGTAALERMCRAAAALIERLAAERDRYARNDELQMRRAIAAEAEVAKLRAQVAKCGGENCMGYRVDGVMQWVREERLHAANREVAKLREALREAKEELQNIVNARPATWKADGIDLSDQFEAWAKNRARFGLARIDALLGATHDR